MLKSKSEHFAYPQFGILASPYFLPHIMEHIISTDGIHIVRKKGLEMVIGQFCIHFSYITHRK